MGKENLPEKFKGYLTKDLLQVWEEIQTPEGTQAPKDVIEAMNDLLRTYLLGMFSVTQNMGLKAPSSD